LHLYSAKLILWSPKATKIGLKRLRTYAMYTVHMHHVPVVCQNSNLFKYNTHMILTTPITIYVM